MFGVLFSSVSQSAAQRLYSTLFTLVGVCGGVEVGGRKGEGRGVLRQEIHYVCSPLLRSKCSSNSADSKTKLRAIVLICASKHEKRLAKHAVEWMDHMPNLSSHMAPSPLPSKAWLLRTSTRYSLAPFMGQNNIGLSVRPTQQEIAFSNGTFSKYGKKLTNGPHKVRHAQGVCAPGHSVTLFPSDFIKASVPEDIVNTTIALELSIDNKHPQWPRSKVTKSIEGLLEFTTR